MMVSLGRDPVVKSLRRAYPKAATAVNSGSWLDSLLKVKSPRVATLVKKEGTSSDMDTDDAAALTKFVVGGYDESSRIKRSFISTQLLFFPTFHIFSLTRLARMSWLNPSTEAISGKGLLLLSQRE